MEKIEDIKTDDDSSHHVPLLQTSKYSQDGDDDDRSDSEKSSRDLTDPSRYSLKDYRQLQQRSCILAITNSISLVFAGICLLLLLLGAKHDSGRKDVTPILLSSPAQNALLQTIKTWPISAAKSHFAGNPRPELELAWHELLGPSMTRFEDHEILDLGLKSLKLKDGGYAAQFGVYHELHCLKKIRHWSYRDHYLSNLTKPDEMEWAAHIDHCIEMLRMSAMCKADTAVSTFSWLGEGSARRPTIIGTGPHQCVDWKIFETWLKGRSIDVSNSDIFEA